MPRQQRRRHRNRGDMLMTLGPNLPPVWLKVREKAGKGFYHLHFVMYTLHLVRYRLPFVP